MQKSEFIITPINGEAYSHLIDEGQPQGWVKRARKLQERRWRKMAGRIAQRENSPHFRTRHLAY
ncbi:MAG: hypothetical protein ACXWLH_02990 [Candidatus Saccharimonadales bacterium]